MNDSQSQLSFEPGAAAEQTVRGGGRALHALETIQTVLTALILAFVFRAYLVEAFIIPTGSMAESLLGAHATLTCPACGWGYDFAAGHDCFCPNCHLRLPLPAENVPLKDGDRILVHKWPYVLGGPFGPQRWDVIVFRNPSDPGENYVKRAVGLPGESVQILDGDLYIDGRIARKTPAAQRALWFVVYDQAHIPVPAAATAGWPRWVAEPTPSSEASGWDGLSARVLRFNAPDDREYAIRFEPDDDRYFQDVCGYNRGPSPWPAPRVGDMRLRAEVTFQDGEGSCRWELTRDDRRFTLTVHRDGLLTLDMACVDGVRAATHIGQTRRGRFRTGRPYAVEFAHVDYRVYAKLDGQTVLATSDEQYHPDVAALRTFERRTPVGLRLAARAADLELRRLRVDRDVHYTYRPGRTVRADASRPFVLGHDEYFVLGDNSPDSHDSREWQQQAYHLPRGRWQAGTVPASQIVGRVAFVYLPGLQPLDAAGKWRLPDVGRVRFVR